MISNKLKVFVGLLVIILGLSLYYLSLPVVLFVKPALHEEFNLLLPGYVSKDYRLRIISEEELQKEYLKFSPELVIFSPFTAKPDYIESKSAIWGVPENYEYDILFSHSDEAMWLKALESVKDINTAFVTEEGEYSHIFDTLKLNDPYIHLVEYSGRISNANIDSIKSELERNETVALFIPAPESAHTLMRENLEVECYVDWRDAAALYNTDVKAIAPDWSEAIVKALNTESGEIPFDFTLISSHKLMKILDSLFL